MASTTGKEGVRFAERDQEMSSEEDLQNIKDVTGLGNNRREDLGPEAQNELQQLRTALQQNNIQNSRMQHHAFEPVSLPGSQPASRVSRATFLLPTSPRLSEY